MAPGKGPGKSKCPHTTVIIGVRAVMEVEIPAQVGGSQQESNTEDAAPGVRITEPKSPYASLGGRQVPRCSARLAPSPLEDSLLWAPYLILGLLI